MDHQKNSHGAARVAFKNWTRFTNYITKTDGTTIDDAEELDLVMSANNFLEYSSNCSDATASLWVYSKDEIPLISQKFKLKLKWGITLF